MTHSLYYKFILGYLVFGLLGFVTIAAVSSDMTYQFLVETKSEALYDEANLLASSYSGVYRGQYLDLDYVQPQMEAVAKYLHSEIWIVNNRGSVIADSSHLHTASLIEGFDPTFTGNKSYNISNYYDSFSYDVLSVSAPITGNYRTYGYVLIHMPISEIQDTVNGFLNILYISSGIIFGLSLIILLVFTTTVYFPLKKITAAATQYAEGNLKHKLTLHTQDEMGYLAATLNFMSDELDKIEE